jgi:hypothetical protein
MKRRDFVLGLAASAFVDRIARAAEPLRDLKITRVVGFDLACRRSKVAGKNSHLDVHGDRATDRMLRIFTNQQIEGIGNLAVDRDRAAELLGKCVADLFVVDERRMTGPLGVGTLPLWDLAGKALGKPVYQLLGGAGPERVGVYDGSIYFADLLPMYEDHWEDRLRDEIDMARHLGHRALKVKIGRGFKWLPRAAGDRRDIDVLRLVRQHAGDDFLIGIDANNGYDLAGTKRLFDEIGDFRIAFAEEMFPEEVEDCLAFKAFLRERGWDTLVADGYSISAGEAALPDVPGLGLQIDEAHFAGAKIHFDVRL